MRDLVFLVLTIPMATADCERDFSTQITQSHINSDNGSTLLQANRNDLVRISMHGPPSQQFDWEAALRARLNRRKRGSCNSKPLCVLE